jgi:hypothetical protein
MDSTTCTAFELVQQMSDSAFTSAVEFTYATTTASGSRAFSRRSESAVTKSAIGQPALRSGISTVFDGDRIFAVSAMKCTPQKTMTSAFVAAASCDRPSESPTKSLTSWISPRW